MPTIEDSLPRNADGDPVTPGMIGWVLSGRRAEAVRVVVMFYEGGDNPHRLMVRHLAGLSKGDERSIRPGELFTSEGTARDAVA